ncbi:MAG: hypothetical protein KDD40_09860 [Bdellovibrionales bacterium]|nr:hypothetical protein [Bdellovibrionales bacterium]
MKRLDGFVKVWYSKIMTGKFHQDLKRKFKDTKQDIDRKLLNLTTESTKAIKSQIKKHTSLDLDKVDINGQLAHDVALKVLEKAQDIRKNITTEELIKASKITGQKVLDSAKSKFINTSSKKKKSVTKCNEK